MNLRLRIKQIGKSCVVLTAFILWTSDCFGGNKASQFRDELEESAACQDSKALLRKNMDTLRDLETTPCPIGREVSCAALKSTLTKINEGLNNKILASCIPHWMYHAAGFDKQDGNKGG